MSYNRGTGNTKKVWRPIPITSEEDSVAALQHLQFEFWNRLERRVNTRRA